MAAILMSLAVLNVVLYWRHYSGITSFPYDFPTVYYAATAYWIASIQAGEWPHWMPYQSMGYPFVANTQTGLFYPPLWLFALLRIPYTLHAANIFHSIHFLAGSVGMFFFCRLWFRHWNIALCGAVAYALYGGFFTNAEHTDIARSFTLLPWLFWALTPRLDEHTATNTVARFGLHSIAARNLLLPAIIFLYVTGSYPGNIVSGFLAAGLYFVATAWTHLRRSEGHGVVALAWMAGLIVLSGLILAVYLLPTGALSSDLYRPSAYSSLQRRYLTPWFPLHMIVPSAVVARLRPDYSMLGMQIPFALLLLLPLGLIRKRASLGVSLVALLGIVMAVQEFSWASEAIRRAIPLLGYSRFPGGDYRTYIYLGLLFACLYGLDALISQGTRISIGQIAVLLGSVGSFLLIFAVGVLDGYLQIDQLSNSWLTWHIAVTLALLAGAFMISMRRLSPRYLLPILIAGMVVGGIATVREMSQYWDDSLVERAYYGRPGLTLKREDHLRVEDIFQQRPVQRLERKDTPSAMQLSWRGYIEGSYMMRDQGDISRTKTSEHIASNDELLQFVRSPGMLVAFPCEEKGVCETSPGVDLSRGRPLLNTPIDYGRNALAYRIQLDAPSLLVENEVYFAQWTATIGGTNQVLKPVPVNGALRGWRAPAGEYDLMLQYQTPYLIEGAVLSLLGIALWCTVAIVRWHPRLRLQRFMYIDARSVAFLKRR